jgi:hypothetical protein
MLKWDGKLWTCGLDLSGCEQAPVVCCCEHHNELLGCVIRVIILTGLTLRSPGPSEAQSLLTCCAAHARVQLVPTYLCMYYNIQKLDSGLGCMEAFME